MKLNFAFMFVAAGTLSAFLMIDQVLESYILSLGAIYGCATVFFLPFFKYGKYSMLKHVFTRTIWILSCFASFLGAFYTATFLYGELGEDGVFIVLSIAGFVGATILLAGVCLIIRLLKLKMRWLFAFFMIIAGSIVPIIATLTLVQFIDGFLALFLLWQCAISILLLSIVQKTQIKAYNNENSGA